MRILVIEDEVKTAKFLKKGLEEAGFVVDVAARWIGWAAPGAGSANSIWSFST